jgi:hypothetical protein
LKTGLKRYRVAVLARPVIFHALQDLAGQELKAADRFRVLEALRNSAHYATSNLNKHVQGLAYPLPDKVMRIASACQAIHDYMANGYITIFHELQKQNSLLIDNRMLTTTIHRAIVYIEQSLLLSYEIYSAFHHDEWEKLHDLYQYAELHKLTKNKVYEPLMHSKRNSSIHEEYLRTLLLYLAEPYHLRPGEINQVHHHLEDWSGLCDLKKISSTTELSTLHMPVIQLNSDQPPKQGRRDFINNIDSEHYRILDTTKLINSLKKDRKQLIKSQSTITTRLNKKIISISLIRRLIESWAHTRQRRFPRQTVNAKVNVTIGLHHAHMQLMYEQHLKKNQNNKRAYSGFHQPQFESIEIKSVEHEHSDVWSTVYAWANSIDTQPAVNSVQFQSDNMPESIVDYRVQQDNWLLVNESAEGLGLVCTETPASRVQVGEVISIQRKNSSERSIGLVRWMKARGETGIELGVMLLAPNASPVGLIAEDPAKGDYVIDRGLLLPLMQILNRPESLLIFSRQYRAGDILAINRPGKDNSWIRLVKLIADNGSISQYLFTRIDHTDKPLQQDGESTNHDQFSDIWLNI